MEIYLLDVRTIAQGTWDADPESLVDAGRKERTLRLPEGAKRNASVAASLLLQYAVGQYVAGQSGDPEEPVRVVSADRVMAVVSQRGPADFAYRYGRQGKPVFADLELPQFNLSHSGDFVALALSHTQCGVDLQKMESSRDVTPLADRFFSPEEAEAVRQEGEETFFRLWTRKEALAKCAGKSLASELGRDLRNLKAMDSLNWVEWKGLPGYLLAACETKE